MIKSRPAEELLPCPFCGAEASIEESEMLGAIRKSAGCHTEGCHGYQSTITFATHREAIAAWNKRDLQPFRAGMRHAAGIVNKVRSETNPDPAYPGFAIGCKTSERAIESAADNLKELP